jgi:hypothetical protein
MVTVGRKRIYQFKFKLMHTFTHYIMRFGVFLFALPLQSKPYNLAIILVAFFLPSQTIYVLLA